MSAQRNSSSVTGHQDVTVNRRKLLAGASSLGLAAAAGISLAPGAMASSSQAGSSALPAALQAGVTNYKTWNLADYEQETGAVIAEFSEAPSLAEQVAAGALPAVRDRLPVQPLVVSPIQEIGTYSGPVSGFGINPTSYGNDVASSRRQFLIGIYPDLSTFAPQIAESYELSADLMTFTAKLRQGMKWSDGAPVTAADIMFWYEDTILNEELTPAINNILKPGGEVIKVTQTDEFTVVFTASIPNPVFVEYLATNSVLMPRHYLEQWHLKYNPDAATLAKDEGFETWVQLFKDKSLISDGQSNADLPSVDPWLFAQNDSLGNKHYARNPYYFKVDTQGQQLPYAEGQVRILTGNVETTVLQIRNGEIDFGAEQLQLKDIAVLREGEEAGGYRALLWEGTYGSQYRYQFNLTVLDPILRTIFQDLRFRQAMSLAVNRAELNDTLFFGQATPRQFTVPASFSLYEDWMGLHYAEFDLDRANQLLDEMGLVRREGDGLRLRSDGEPILFTIDDCQFNEAMDELMIEYWRALGITAQVKSLTRELYSERAQANQHEASVWDGGIVDEINVRILPVSFRPPWGIDNVPHSGSAWHKWYLTEGAEGEEPPEEILSLYTLVDQFQQLQRGTPEYAEVGKEMLTRNLDGLYVVGTVGMAPQIVIASNNLRNFPEVSTMMLKMQHAHGDQWYLAE